VYHTIIYEYKMELPPATGVPSPVVVHTYLPDRIVVKTWLYRDDLGLQRAEPSAQRVPQR
jgi:hypothetical protein